LLASWVHGTSDHDKIDDQKGALAIFIDDLDRCLPEKTVQVLEAVKLFLDKPGCVQFWAGSRVSVSVAAICTWLLLNLVLRKHSASLDLPAS
jgi:hypothetical protein